MLQSWRKKAKLPNLLSKKLSHAIIPPLFHPVFSFFLSFFSRGIASTEALHPLSPLPLTAKRLQRLHPIRTKTSAHPQPLTFLTLKKHEQRTTSCFLTPKLFHISVSLFPQRAICYLYLSKTLAILLFLKINAVSSIFLHLLFALSAQSPYLCPEISRQFATSSPFGTRHSRLRDTPPVELCGKYEILRGT